MTIVEGTLEYTVDPSDGAPMERPFAIEPQLFVCFGPDPHAPASRHRLGEVDRVVVGRSDVRSFARTVVDGFTTLHIALADPRISGHHCAFVRRRDGWALEDSESKNGTEVDGVPITKVALSDGAIIAIGRSTLLFRSAVPVDPAGPLDVTADRLPREDDMWATFHDPLARSYRKLAAVADSSLPILVFGETGSGKEIVAQVLHRISGRPGPMVAVNCAAVPESLAEAEFFGHLKGAFTGADSSRPGYIRRADKGTLFLDEIGDLRATSQAVILRALDTRVVTPVGGHTNHQVDFRLVSATNVDLDAAIADGRFRADLRGRLGQFVVDLPPLCERREDIALLVPRLMQRLGVGPLALHPEAARRLLSARWPGNVRDLLSVVEAAVAQAGGRRVEARHLPDVPALHRAPPRRIGSGPPPGSTPEEVELHGKLVDALTRHKGNVAAVSRELGVHRQQLHRWFKKFGISPDDYRD